MSKIATDRQERKDAPLARGVLDYFPAALEGVARCSRIANEQHNPGEEMHWARDKSNDHADCILRHMVQRNEMDEDGIPHVAKIAWRALALAQEWYEAQGAEPGYASKWNGQSLRETFIEETTKTEAPLEEPKFKLHDRWYNDIFECGGSVVGLVGNTAYIKWDYCPNSSAYFQYSDTPNLTLVRRG